MTISRAEQRDARIRSGLSWLRRYEPLIDDPKAFEESLQPGPPVDLLVPPGTIPISRVQQLLEGRGLVVQRFPWAPHHLRVHEWEGAGSLPEVVFGFAYSQGVASSLAPRVLAETGGRRLLDACAAPGGKTVYLAAAAAEGTRILAGDVTTTRTGLLVQSLSRHGIASAVVVQQDAGGFPAAGPFDGVLLDAPCTGEGTFRAARPRYEPGGEQALARAAALQRRLLVRAIDLLAPGGHLVYSTCTYAPEENEAVLTEVLSGRQDVDVLDLPDDVPGLPGTASWAGQQLDPRVVRCRRLFPHHTGSWGFFVALLQKSESATRVAKPRHPGPAQPPRDDTEAHRQVVEYLRRRFGCDENVLEDYLVVERGRDLWLLSSASSGHPDVDLAGLRVVAPGLRALRRAGRGVRATSALLRSLNANLQDNVIDAGELELFGALKTGSFPAPGGSSPGQVALRVEGRVVSGGFVHGDQVDIELPKAWR